MIAEIFGIGPHRHRTRAEHIVAMPPKRKGPDVSDPLVCSWKLLYGSLCRRAALLAGVTVTGLSKRKDTSDSDGNRIGSGFVIASTPAPAPAPVAAPMAAPLPPPAIAPMIAPSAAPPPTVFAVRAPRDEPSRVNCPVRMSYERPL